MNFFHLQLLWVDCKGLNACHRIDLINLQGSMIDISHIDGNEEKKSLPNCHKIQNTLNGRQNRKKNTLESYFFLKTGCLELNFSNLTTTIYAG